MGLGITGCPVELKLAGRICRAARDSLLQTPCSIQESFDVQCALDMNSAVTGTLHSLYSQTTTLDFPELESASMPFPACPA